jgi:NTP pyrophosphatase (non-canonical NTP hydrolase)
MKYALYHIPGKKIGVTNNLKYRVEEQQGYEPGEYEILAWSDDISYISTLEREMQVQYGYPVDEKLYEKLFTNDFKEFNKMKINVTEATTTFPCPINKLKGQLMDELGMQWETAHGEFTITQPTINWIMANVKTSQYSNDRCYIYNKAMAKYYDHNPHRNITVGTTHKAEVSKQASERELARVNGKVFEKPDVNCKDCHKPIFDCIREWADERGLYDKGDPKTQYIKLMEETGEIGRALLKDDTNEIVDGIGDAVVVLTNLAELIGVPIEECIQSAYDVISKRTGKMINGTFVKDQPITSYGRANLTQKG